MGAGCCATVVRGPSFTHDILRARNVIVVNQLRMENVNQRRGFVALPEQRFDGADDINHYALRIHCLKDALSKANHCA